MLFPILPPPLGINGLECALIAVATSALFVLGGKAGWSKYDRCIAVVLILPVLILTAAEATQFMTMDEWGLTAELFNPRSREFRSISLGAFGVGLPVALPLVRLAEALHLAPETERMLLKSLWWLLGQAVVAALTASLLILRSGIRRIEPHIFAAVFAALALLPTTQLALKTFNYDLFSFGLGTLAVLLIFHHILAGDRRTGWGSLLCAALAAREKLTGGPILLLVVIALSLTATNSSDTRWERSCSAVRAAAVSLGVALGISLMALAIYAALAGRTIEGPFWVLTLDPLIAWAWVPLGTFVSTATMLVFRPWLALAIAMLYLAIVIALANFYPALNRILGQRLNNSRQFAVVTLVVFVSVFIAGAIGTGVIHGYWAPFHPTALAKIALLQTLNGVALHVDAATMPEHLWKIVIYALTVMVVAIPTAVWITGVLGAIGLVALANRKIPSVPKTVLALVALALITPVLSALLGMPFAHRYFNLNLALLANAMLLGASTVAAHFERRHYGIIVFGSALFIGGLLIEVAPFRPLFAAFRPLWLEYSDAHRAQPGELNPSWMGWGEEVMTGGKYLEHACREQLPVVASHPCSDISLVVMHSGLWLPGSRDISVTYFSQVAAAPPLNENTFYMVNRLYLVQNLFPIPNIDPDISISYRGYDLAWVWRGDRLKTAGYTFKK